MLNEWKYFKKYKALNPHQLTEKELKKIEKEIKFKRDNLIFDEYLDFKLWYQGKPSRQEAFAEYIQAIIPCDESLNILEVGGGRLARLSNILAEKGYHMTCIDPQVDTKLQNMITIKDKFDYRTFDLSLYDYIIAQEPCEASEHIVRACLLQDKPFMIVLCGVAHQTISGKVFDDVLDWYTYLFELTNQKARFKYIKLNSQVTSLILTNIER